jgi:hypothetical protein
MNYDSKPDISVNMGALLSAFSFKKALEKYAFIEDDLIQGAKKYSRAPLSIQVSELSVLQAYTNALLHEVRSRIENLY